MGYQYWLKAKHKKKPAKKEVNTLSDLEVEEVSLVDEAANGRKFLVVKNRSSETEMPMEQTWLNEAATRALDSIAGLTKRIAEGDETAVSAFISALRAGADSFEFDACAAGLIEPETVRKGRSLAAAVMRGIEKKAKADSAERLVTLSAAGRAASLSDDAMKKMLFGGDVKATQAQITALEKHLGAADGSLVKAAQRDGLLAVEKAVAAPVTPAETGGEMTASAASSGGDAAAPSPPVSGPPSGWRETFKAGQDDIMTALTANGTRLDALEKTAQDVAQTAADAKTLSASQLLEGMQTQNDRIKALEKGVGGGQAAAVEHTQDTSPGQPTAPVWPYDLNSSEEDPKVNAPQTTH